MIATAVLSASEPGACLERVQGGEGAVHQLLRQGCGGARTAGATLLPLMPEGLDRQRTKVGTGRDRPCANSEGTTTARQERGRTVFLVRLLISLVQVLVTD